MQNEDKNITTKDIFDDSDNKNNDNSNQKEQKKKSSIVKYIIYLTFILIITGVVLISSLWGDTGSKVFSLFTQMNTMYFSLFILAIFINIILASFILFLFVKLYYKHYKFHQALANQLVGNFYNGITPGASGGQVAQIYTFNKQGISISSAASVMVMSYIVYQSCLIIMGIISVATHIQDVMAIQTIDLTINGQDIPVPIVIFVILGFALNLFVIALLFIMSYSRRLHNFVSVHLINFLAKIHLIKNPNKVRETVRVQVENFRIEFRRLQSNIPFTILVVFLSFISLWITDSYPFLSGLALNGFNSFSNAKEVIDKIFLSIVFTNFHQMITGLIPLPGSSGVSEFIFLRLFTGYFNADGFVENGGVNAVMLLWRFMTFHIPFFVSGIIAGTYKSRGIPKKDRFIQSDRDAFVTIQVETYNERRVTSDTAYYTSVFERKELLDKIKKNKNNLNKNINSDDNKNKKK